MILSSVERMKKLDHSGICCISSNKVWWRPEINMSVQFSSVTQSCPTVTPWTTTCQASLSITNSQSSPKPMSIVSVMPSNHLILCHPLLLLPSIFPSIRVFSNDPALYIRWPKYWSFSKKAKWLSEEALKIAVKRREVKSKGEKERYSNLNAEFQRIARRDKKDFLSYQCKEIEENNRMGKTRDLFKKIRDTKGTFHAKMGSIKDRNCRDLTEANDIRKRWQEYTEELYKRDLHDPDNHDGVITHLEPDILECEVKWALGSITTNKASRGDGIPVELFQILKDDAVKVLHSICQQIWKLYQKKSINKKTTYFFILKGKMIIFLLIQFLVCIFLGKYYVLHTSKQRKPNKRRMKGPKIKNRIKVLGLRRLFNFLFSIPLIISS